MVWGIISLLFGVGFGTAAVIGMRRRLGAPLRALRHGQVADGFVSGITTQVVGAGTAARRLPHPIVTFTDARGVKTKYVEMITPPGSGKAGEHFTVHYDPAAPERTATIATWADVRRRLMGAAVIILVLLAFCVNGVLLILGVLSA